MDIKVDIGRTGIAEERIKAHSGEVAKIIDGLWSGNQQFTGWVKRPLYMDKQELEDILNTAVYIQSQCKEMIVIGVGGSYLGAKAGIHSLVGQDEIYDTGITTDMFPEVKFAGTTLSAVELSQFLDDIRRKDVTLCVISKSGNTIEPHVAFEVLKEAMIDKYGKEQAVERIYAITDKDSGRLREEADREGYTCFEVPGDIGGRYSVLTAVGLLPMAVAGVDINSMLAGAELMASSPRWDTDATDYAIARFELMESCKMEILECYEPQLYYFSEWLKQLFGESEGKEGRGLYPDNLQLSTDLHSMGQFLQQGTRMFFETVLNIERPARDIIVPAGANPLVAGKSLNALNKAAMEGVIKAHADAGIPIVKIDIPELDAFNLGQMFYFFEMTCAVTASLMGVNPFDQPGVELYKAERGKNFEEIQPIKF